MTEPPGHGDDDPVAQFSDPELRHGYAEYPTGAFPPAPAGGGSGCLGGWSRRRLVALLIVVLIVAVAAGLVAGLAH
jgi:hypothetical protein